MVRWGESCGLKWGTPEGTGNTSRFGLRSRFPICWSGLWNSKPGVSWEFVNRIQQDCKFRWWKNLPLPFHVIRFFAILYPLDPSPALTRGDHWSVLYPSNFALSRMSCSWTHTVQSLLSLASFPRCLDLRMFLPWWVSIVHPIYFTE